jgi:hypothetical protein
MAGYRAFVQSGVDGWCPDCRPDELLDPLNWFVSANLSPDSSLFIAQGFPVFPHANPEKTASGI